MNEFESRFADVNGLRLHYLEWAGGEPVVLCLPGITANAYAFAALAEQLSPRHRIIALDLRGRGGSDKPPAGYDIGTHVSDVVGLLDRLAIRRPALVGWSLGAKVALAFAALHLDRVDRVVLIDPPVKTSPAATTSLRAFWTRLDRTYSSVDEFLARMRASWSYTEWSPYVEAYLRADVEEQPGGIVRHRIPRRVPEEELQAEDRYPTVSFYAGVRCPVLIVRAVRPLAEEGDQVLRPEEAREMAARLAEARLIEVPDANHFSVLLGNSAGVFEQLAEFLDPVAARAAAETEAETEMDPVIDGR